MSCEFVVFIHGVSTRYEGVKPNYADHLIDRLRKKSGNRQNFKPIVLYWGDIGAKSDQLLLHQIQKSPDWNKLWFREFRSQQMLDFIGDAALYISRYKASQVVATLAQQTLDNLLDYNPKEDKLHIVSHSLGTVILFDILFASRWDDVGLPGYDNVQKIRDTIFGIEPTPKEGIRLASIHTMGSPVALFYLMDIDQSLNQIAATALEKVSTHDITPNLQKLLGGLYQELGNQKLPWRNFIHPGDPIAYPLVNIIPELVDDQGKYVDIQDIVTQDFTFSNFVSSIFSNTPLALINAGEAHGSYWNNSEVANKIAETLFGLKA